MGLREFGGQRASPTLICWAPFPPRRLPGSFAGSKSGGMYLLRTFRSPISPKPSLPGPLLLPPSPSRSRDCCRGEESACRVPGALGPEARGSAPAPRPRPPLPPSRVREGGLVAHRRSFSLFFIEKIRSGGGGSVAGHGAGEGGTRVFGA